MTIESTRATTAPDLVQQLRAAGNRPTMPGRLPGSVLVHSAILRIAADEIERLSIAQPSPSTGGDPAKVHRMSEEGRAQLAEVIAKQVGGEPATDSAGQPAKKMGFVALTDHLMALADVQDCDITLHFANGGQLQVKKSPNRPLAAREPAPVARELDVEAERRAFAVAMKEGWPGVVDPGDDDYWDQGYGGIWRAARKFLATAESAPASAAPDEQEPK